jgi:hypothetical protein
MISPIIINNNKSMVSKYLGKLSSILMITFFGFDVNK